VTESRQPAPAGDRDSDRRAALQAFGILRERATTYALAGTAIAVTAVILGTLLVCVQVYDGITLDNIQRAHRENVAIWALDAMPFLFGLWGQYANLRMAREAGSLMESGTEDLRRELEEVQYTAGAKTEFFARMSHELRTPLNAILGMSDLLAEGDDPARRRERARIIHDSAESLLTLINDVLDLSRIEAGRMEIDSVEFDLREHLNGAAGLLEPQAAGKGIRLISLVPPDAPRRIVGDPGRLRQVLINLLGNSIKFTDDGEVVLSLRRWTREDDGYQLSIEVADTGVGIASEELERLFEPYRQAARQGGGGTGLGLSITRELVRAMGGEISVDSTPGRGSAFTFTIRVGLPVAVDDRGPATSVDLHGRRVLLADGDAHGREALGGQLEALGMEVTTVGDGVEAMKAALRAAARERSFDLLLTDMFLPNLSGEDLGRRLLGRPGMRETCVAIMTTAGARGDAKRLNEAGFSAYLLKPLPPGQLQELMGAILATRSLSPGERRRKGLVTRHSIAEGAVGDEPVLVVDDSEVNREIALQQLQRLGIEGEAVAGAAAALEALEHGSFDAILLDAHLPDGDADEVIPRLRAARPAAERTPVIVFSAGLTADERARCERAGADGILVKPAADADLRAALASRPGYHPAPTAQATAAEPRHDEAEPAADPAVTPTLARLFLGEAESRMASIRGTADEGHEPDYEAIAREAHGLKGASQHLPEPQFTDTASRLEQAALSGQEPEVRAAIEDLVAQWEPLRQRLDHLADDGTD